MPSKSYLPGSDYPPPPPPVGGGEWPWARGRDPGRSGHLVDQGLHIAAVSALSPFTRRRRKGWSDMHREVTGGRAFLEAAAGTWAGFSVGRFIPSAYNTLRPGSPFAMYSINTAVQIAGGVVGAIGAASDSPYAAAFGAGMNWAGYVGKYSDTLAATIDWLPRTVDQAVPYLNIGSEMAATGTYTPSGSFITQTLNAEAWWMHAQLADPANWPWIGGPFNPFPQW